MLGCSGTSYSGAVIVILLHATVINSEVLDETLTLRPLHNKLVHANFKSIVQSSPHTPAIGHYNLFPKALGEILHKYNVQELELSLTQGNWRYSQWGIPPDGAATPSGAAILVLFSSNTNDVQAQWKGLVNSLSGLICASLNFVDETVTTIPKYTFYPRGAFSVDKPFNNSFLRYANLPQENVCTENLTPWKKLLPCVGKAGLSSLLNPKPLYSSHYHSLSLVVRPECDQTDCSTRSLSLTQSLSVVLEHTAKHFTLKSLFHSTISQACHIARHSKILVESPSDGPLSLSLNPPGDDTLQKESTAISTYVSIVNLNMKATYHQEPVYRTPPAPVIHFQRYLTGYGQEYGSIVCEITNSEEEHLQLVYTEYIPWFLRLYLHTLSIRSGEMKITPVKMSYSPGLERKKPYLLELLLNIPANATTVIQFDVDKLFLKWTEYNPDASLGFYTPAAIITVMLPDAPPDAAIQTLKDNYSIVRFYTEKLLVLLPTPDFSMPYNVICLACTVVALAFGSFHNLTTKTLVRETEPPQSWLQKFKKFLGMNVDKTEVTKLNEGSGDGADDIDYDNADDIDYDNADDLIE
ncbi:GPI transamidase component PIG-T-like [Watersipora subatra]|uniref:GPI transamidase component PIG-T-like n=1 Tax=Watersipora subatra TaxID=2589382 RepID=UPI00355C3B30